MKQLLAWLFGWIGGKKKPPVIVVPPPPPPPPPPPLKLTWPDKRPIGMVMLANYTHWTGTDNYMSEDFVATAQACIQNMKELNAQGLIVWDPEGTKFPRAYTYYGDPRLAPEKVNPFFAAITVAGFRVGVCLRPDVIIMTMNPADAEHWAGMETPDHYVAASPLQDLIGKVEYARARWGATLFYVDSNVGVGLAPGTKNTIGSGNLMPSSIFAELHKLYPDCLFIPEHSDEQYKATAMPYYPKNHPPPSSGGYVIDCGDTPWTTEQLKAAVAQGNILMGRVWYAAPELPLIKAAYLP